MKFYVKPHTALQFQQIFNHEELKMIHHLHKLTLDYFESDIQQFH